MQALRPTTAVLALVLATSLSAGCKSSTPGGGSAGAGGGGGSAVTIDDASRQEAESIFATRCTVCHGPKGQGDGPGSAGLNPKPRNFTDKTWQTSVTDEHIEKIVQYGGAAVGKSPAMPPNPDLMAKPSVVAALRAHVRSLGQ